MQIIERLIWLVAIAVLGVSLYMSKSELSEMQDWVEKQNEQLLLLDNLINDAVSNPELPTRDEAVPTIEVQTDFMMNSERRRLISQGFADPVNSLKQNLIDRPDLIKHEGVLGGTMRVYSPSDIVLLPGGWAYATFEDGHISGGLLLEFSVDNGKIEWNVIRRKLF